MIRNRFILIEDKYLPFHSAASEVLKVSKRRDQPDVLGLTTFGLFLILAGVMLMTTPNLLERGWEFLRDLEIQKFSSHMYLPAPKSNHLILFTALSRFSFYFAILHVPILVARLILKNPVDKTAGTVSGLVFWFGATWIINQLVAGSIAWFVFLGYLIALIGVSIVVQNAVILGARSLRS